MKKNKLIRMNIQNMIELRKQHKLEKIRLREEKLIEDKKRRNEIKEKKKQLNKEKQKLKIKLNRLNRTPEQIEKDKEYQKVYRIKTKEIIKENKLKENRTKLYNEIDVKSFEWKDVEGFDGILKISSGGHVINVKRMVQINPYKSRLGYLIISVNQKGYSHHRMLAKAFIPNPENKPEVNHKNGIRDDNRLENLEWVTRAENIQHSFKELGRKSNLIGVGGKKKKNN